MNGEELVKAVGEIDFNFRGNIIHKNWFKTITCKGKPYISAIILLSEIVGWYRPKKVIENGEVKFIKRFSGEYLNLIYSYLIDTYGLSKSTFRRALKFLISLNLISIKYEDKKIKGRYFNNIQTIKINPEKLAEVSGINLKETENEGLEKNVDSLQNDEEKRFQKHNRVSKTEVDSLQNDKEGGFQKGYDPRFKKGRTNTIYNTRYNNSILTIDDRDREYINKLENLTNTKVSDLSSIAIENLKNMIQEEMVSFLKEIKKSSYLLNGEVNWLLENYKKVLSGFYREFNRDSESKGFSKEKFSEKKNGFHNFKQLSDDYEDGYLEALAKKKREMLYRKLSGF